MKLEPLTLSGDPHLSVKQPGCLGYKYWTDCGWEYDCEYPTTLTCDECKYGCGRKNPEAKCNTLEDE